MKSFTLSITTLLVLTLLTLAGNFLNTSLAQDNMTAASNNSGAKMGNQTNQTGGGGGQQNQTDIGTASQIENLTSGNTLQNASDIGGGNASLSGGLNETGEALANASKSGVAQNISQGAQEIGQTVANKTGDILGSMSEGLKGLGEGSQSK